jgi:urate oxidase
MAVTLGHNQYGKAEIRMVRVTRDGGRQELKDLNVGTALAGDLIDVHLSSDNANVVPTDTQKNTVYAFAKEGPSPAAPRSSRSACRCRTSTTSSSTCRHSG